MRQAERRAETQARLIAIARGAFSQRGYEAVSTDEIVKAAGLTRGALYHHFGGKLELFAAVVDEIQREIGNEIIERAEATENAWDALIEGSIAFLDACSLPGVQRVLLIDAPAVLGWDRWREIDERYGSGSLSVGIAEAIDAGFLPEQPIQPLTHLLTGAMNELALWVARSENAQMAGEQARAALLRMLNGLRHN